MVKGSAVLFREAGVAKKLAEILVCPLSKQPLRECEETKSLISDALSVSYPIVDGIPCLVPKDGKLLDSDVEPDENKGADTTDLSAKASDTF